MNEVKLKIGTHEALVALKWAREHCPSYVTNTGYDNHEGQLVYSFYFYDEKDSLHFMLRWS
jgi:hypothetical protein